MNAWAAVSQPTRRPKADSTVVARANKRFAAVSRAVSFSKFSAWQMRGLHTVAPGPWLPLDGLIAKAQVAAPEGYRLRHISPPLEPGPRVPLVTTTLRAPGSRP